MAARVRFEHATLRTEGTELITEPPRPINVCYQFKQLKWAFWTVLFGVFHFLNIIHIWLLKQCTKRVSHCLLWFLDTACSHMFFVIWNLEYCILVCCFAGCPIKFNFAILVAGFKSRSSPHDHLYTKKITVPTLHVYGSSDKVIAKRMYCVNTLSCSVYWLKHRRRDID